MNEMDKQRLIAMRKESIAEHGATEAGVDWSHKHPGRQLLHFEILRQIEGFSNTDSLLDVGCGFGDLAAYLRRDGWRGDYLGIDISAETIATGKKKHPGLNLQVKDILADPMPEQYDWVFCSGALNYKCVGCNNYDYLGQMLGAMFAQANKGVAFNLLSPLVDYEQDISFHPRFDRLLPLVTGLTKRFTLRHDFVPYEFAVYMYKKSEINNEGLHFSEVALPRNL